MPSWNVEPLDDDRLSSSVWSDEMVGEEGPIDGRIWSGVWSVIVLVGIEHGMLRLGRAPPNMCITTIMVLLLVIENLWIGVSVSWTRLPLLVMW